jgi:hypothetical protein
MFTGVKHRFPALSPPLKTEQVVAAIAAVLNEGRSQVVALPAYVSLSMILFRLLPPEWADKIKNLTGANSDMDGFQGSLSSK